MKIENVKMQIKLSSAKRQCAYVELNEFRNQEAILFSERLDS